MTRLFALVLGVSAAMIADAGLPSGYVRVEYIQSTGCQWVDTGVCPTPKTEVVVDFQLTEVVAKSRIFGVEDSGTGKLVFCVYVNGDKVPLFSSGLKDASGDWKATSPTVAADLERHVTSLNAQTRVHLMSTENAGTAGYQRSKLLTTSAAKTLYLLATHTGSDTAGNRGKMKLYSARIFENKKLVRDYVPCVNGEGEAGLYDTVNGAFVTTPGSVPLLAPTAAFAATLNPVAKTADLSFAASDFPRKLYLACGDTDGGETTNAWQKVVCLADVPAGATSLAGVALPVGSLSSVYRHYRAFMFYAGNFSASSYVQDGLTLQYDGVENVGIGQHAASTQTWVDLKGGRNLTLTTDDTVGADSVQIGKTVHTASSAVFSEYKLATFEIYARPSDRLSTWITSAVSVEIPGVGELGWDIRCSNDPLDVMRPTTLTGTPYLYYRCYECNYSDPTNFFNEGSYQTYSATPGSGGKSDPDSTVYVNGVRRAPRGALSYTATTAITASYKLNVGSANCANNFKSIRIYDRDLTEAERLHNRAVDQARFEPGTPCLVSAPLSLAFADETGRQNVMADAAFWYVGAEDKNGNGQFDEGELPDRLRPNDADATTHQAKRLYGAASNALVRTTDVYSPTMDCTLTDQSCLYLRQAVDEWVETIGSEAKTIRRGYPAGVQLPFAPKTDEYTFLCRFRPGDGQTQATGTYANIWLASLGCEFGKKGTYLGFSKDNLDGDMHVMYTTGGSYREVKSMVVSNQFWHEIACVVSGKTARVMLANAAVRGGQARPLFATDTVTATIVSNKCWTLAPGTKFCLCNGSGSSPVTKTNSLAISKDFRGDIHMLAGWNRALSTEEVIEAFGAPSGMSLWRMGLPRHAGQVFGEPTAGDVAVSAQPQDWKNVPQRLAPGQRLSIGFDVEARMAGLPQAVRLVAEEGSAATVEIFVDGVSVGAAEVRGATPALAFVDRRKLTAGHHTCTVERTDSGTGALALETLEMCGSWQIGVDNNGAGEFGSYGPTRPEPPGLTLAAKAYSATSSDHATKGAGTIKIRFAVPPEFLGDCRFFYETSHPYQMKSVDNSQRFILNGTPFALESVPVSTSKETLGKDCRVQLPNALLQGGVNTLEIRVDQCSATSNWLQFDYHRLVMKPNAGLALLLR